MNQKKNRCRFFIFLILNRMVNHWGSTKNDDNGASSSYDFFVENLHFKLVLSLKPYTSTPPSLQLAAYRVSKGSSTKKERLRLGCPVVFLFLRICRSLRYNIK